jgi:hypothetical protein
VTALSAADRQRRLRDRQRRGERVYPLALGDELLMDLIDVGLVPDADPIDAASLAAVTTRALRRLVADQRKSPR